MDLATYFVKIKAGEMDYFHPFYEASKKAIFYNIFALCKDYALSEDILEETYLSFLKNIDKIDNSENILGYLMRISKNLTLDYFKKNSRIILSDDIYQQGENDTYYLLKRTEVPTIIVECGFLSNYEEAEKLIDENYQEQIADVIGEGIITCLEN